MSQSPQDVNTAFRQLAAKYAVAAPAHWTCQLTPGPLPEDGLTLTPGWTVLAAPVAAADRFVPLLPWRCERRFVELKRLVDNRTLETLTMCRFSCQTTGAPFDLSAILYREFDLVEWLTGAPITTIQANVAAECFANVLVRVAGGVVCSVEAGVTLPAHAQPPVLDRHELIARRGVASDRVVDTQVPQSSIYTFTAAGAQTYTDIDAELFGMDADQINLVRAAYSVAVEPEQIDALRRQHRHLCDLLELVPRADALRQRLVVEGARR